MSQTAKDALTVVAHDLILNCRLHLSHSVQTGGREKTNGNPDTESTDLAVVSLSRNLVTIYDNARNTFDGKCVYRYRPAHGTMMVPKNRKARKAPRSRTKGGCTGCAGGQYSVESIIKTVFRIGTQASVGGGIDLQAACQLMHARRAYLEVAYHGEVTLPKR